MAAETKQQQEEPETPKSSPTERIILAGIDMGAKGVVSELIKQCGEPLTKDEEKLLNRLAKDGKITVWVELGESAGGTKKKAIEALLTEDQPGKFRAPGKAAWQGGIAKRVPEKVALDVEALD